MLTLPDGMIGPNNSKYIWLSDTSPLPNDRCVSVNRSQFNGWLNSVDIYCTAFLLELVHGLYYSEGVPPGGDR